MISPKKKLKQSTKKLNEIKKNEEVSLWNSSRKSLKTDVYNRRKEINVIKGQLLVRPVCAICNKPFDDYNEPSMHEVLLTRGDVKGLDIDEHHVLNVPMNVVLVHEGDCHIYAQHTPKGKMKCLRQIIKYEGLEAITNYLKGYEQTFPTLKLDRAKQLVTAYRENDEYWM